MAARTTSDLKYGNELGICSYEGTVCWFDKSARSKVAINSKSLRIRLRSTVINWGLVRYHSTSLIESFQIRPLPEKLTAVISLSEQPHWASAVPIRAVWFARRESKNLTRTALFLLSASRLRNKHMHSLYMIWKTFNSKASSKYLFSTRGRCRRALVAITTEGAFKSV